MDKIDWYSYRDKFLLANKNLKYKSILGYKGGINKFIECLELNNINRPIPEDIFTFIFYLQKETQSLFTQNLYNIAVKKFFAHLSQSHIGLYPDIYKVANPKIPRPNRERHYRDSATDEELKKLKDACKGPDQIDKRDGLIIELIAYCGLRVIEISILKIEDLRKEGDNYTIWILQKNKNKKRPIFCNPNTGKRLLSYIENYRIKGYIFKDTVHNESARPHLNSATITSIIGARMEIAGIKHKNMTAQSLRHYAGKKYFEKSGNLEATQQFMGHESKQTTEKYAQETNDYENNKISLEPKEDEPKGN